MNPTVNKSDFEDLTTNLRDLAYSYLEKYSPSKQQLKIYLLKKYLTKIKGTKSKKEVTLIIDEIISEPIGGAHRNPEAIAEDIKFSILKNLRTFENFSREEIYEDRKAKFLKIGRSQGFSKSSSSDAGLSYKGSEIQKIKNHFLKNKLVYLGISLVLIVGLISIIY